MVGDFIQMTENCGISKLQASAFIRIFVGMYKRNVFIVQQAMKTGRPSIMHAVKGKR